MQAMPVAATSLIPFHGAAIEALMHEGEPFVVVKRICGNLGIAEEPQVVKLKSQPWAVTTMIVATGPDGKQYKMFCCNLDTLPMWLAGINASKVAPRARPQLVLYQKECARVLRDHFLGRRQEAGVTAALQMEVLRLEVAALRARLDRLEATGPVRPALPETPAAEATPADLLLDRIRSGVLGQRFSARDVYLRHWKGLDQADVVGKACRVLEALGHLQAEHSGSRPGRPSTVYLVITN